MKTFKFRGKTYKWDIKKGTAYPYMVMVAGLATMAGLWALLCLYTGYFQA